MLRNTHDFLLDLKWSTTARELTNPLNRFGAKFFSQSDEDGITLEIIRRIGLKTGTFLELGVGDGLENNTLVLLSVGWRGAWFGGETLAFDPQSNPKHLYYKQAPSIPLRKSTGFVATRTRISPGGVSIPPLMRWSAEPRATPLRHLAPRHRPAPAP